MTIAKYQELTGLTVADNQISTYNAHIRRTRAMLESLLGYSLDKKKVSINYYEEVGKSQNECGCYDDGDNLNAPDDVVNAYRLFSYNSDDSYLAVDPYTTIHAVKLVYIRQTDLPDGVTVKTLENARAIKKQGVGKYIENCQNTFCECTCEDCVMLAVDADWLFEDCLPDELAYIWADSITYQDDCKNNIKSETLGTHSYTKFDNTDPFVNSRNLATLKKYAGPNGTLFRMPV